DRERSPVSSFFRESRCSVISRGTYAPLKLPGSEATVSASRVLLASLNALVYRYTGTSDVTIGAVLGGNITVLRTLVSTDQTVADLIRLTSTTLDEAASHADCPFNEIAEAVARETGGDKPLFSIAFAFSPLTAPFDRDAFTYADELARCDLVFLVNECADGGGVIDCDYDAELFDAATVERFLRHWTVLLDGMATDPTCAVGNLPLLSPTDLQQLLVEWNRTETAFP